MQGNVEGKIGKRKTNKSMERWNYDKLGVNLERSTLITTGRNTDECT